mgnify:CR=1 FL=1
MAYIGRQLVRGQNRIYDDISSSFNGSTTAFNLTIGGDATPPAQVNQLWIVLGGILQKPGTDFTVADSQVTFTTAPASGLDFWAMIQGDTSDMNAPSDGSVTPTKIATSGDFAFPADVRFKDADGSHYVGLQAPTTVSSNLVWTLPAADGSANQILKTNGSGVLGWATDSATDSTKMPLAGGTFTGDVTFDGATAGRDIIWDRSADAIIFNDNAKSIFGTSSDGLEIYHDGSNSYITDGGTGSLKILSNSLAVRNAADGEDIALFLEDGRCEFYFDNSKKFETKTDGVLVTGELQSTTLDVNGNSHLDGTVEITSHIYQADSDKHYFGTGNDLIIQHDGTNSTIANTTGRLIDYVNTNEIAIDRNPNGSVDLYYNNLLKLQTHSQGITIRGEEGEEARLLLNADEGDDNADKWRIEADTAGSLNLSNYASGSWERNLACAGGGNVELFHNDTKMFETTAAGCKLTGGGGNGLLIENSGGTNAACLDLKNTLSSYVKEYRIAVAGSDGAYATASSLFIRDQTSGANRFEVQSGGDVKVTTGDLYFGGAGKGIVLGVTSNTASNTLDDYEEGTFTPAITGSTSNPSYTASTASGEYTKIGNICHIQILMIITGVTSQGSGNWQITGAPFNSGGQAYSPMGIIGYNDIFATYVSKVYLSGTTLVVVPDGVTQSNQTFAQNAFSTGYFSISLTYKTT